MANEHDIPIAVVGMGCRFPGDATSVDDFWNFMVDARSAITEVPQDRFNVDSFYHPSSKRQGTMNVKHGYFLKEDISRFDAPFFSMTRDEAEATDPQQRLLLEVAYQAFENAGLTMTSLAGSPTSVFSACFMTDYKQISSFDSEDQPGYGSTGHSAALVANRVSWFFDLRGSSVTLDTGCSGSAVAFHLACESIRSGDAECALACGVNLILAPEPWMSMTAFNFLSPDGKSYTFDHRANGYARGEGFAAIVLKPLGKAIRDNDTIRAVIRATAVAQDGKTPGITLASRSAQASLLRSAYHKFGLEMAQTGFFEAHGTGTVAGDAAELGAIGDAFSTPRRPDEPLIVGSVKTNVGHLEGTASLAGIIKAVLSVEKGVIPQNLNFERPNPKNDLAKYRVTVPTSLTKWPLQGIRRASINCFGFGGTIAHVILDDAESFLTERMIPANHITNSQITNDDSSRTISNDSSQPTFETIPYRLLVLSSPEQDGVKRNAEALASYNFVKANTYEATDMAHLENLCYTLNLRRTQFQWRSAVAVQKTNEASERLKALPKASKTIEECKVCFVFTGQGAQWPGMGRELLMYPAFESSLRAADAFMRILGADWSIVAELKAAPTSSRLSEPELSQAACTVLQCALVDLLKSWSISPSACVGHSSGEIAAAYAAGAITRESAWKLAFYRGKASSEAVPGSMLAVGLSADNVVALIRQSDYQGYLNIACYNGPQNTTVSGDTQAIQALASSLDNANIFSRILKVDRAYHSAYMQTVASSYKNSLGELQSGTEGICKAKVFSSVIGKEITHADIDADYFVQNLVSPVKFFQALTVASDAAQTDLVLEIGPHSALKGAVKQSLASTSGTQTIYASMLQRNEHACKTAVEAAGSLWSHGLNVDLAAVNELGDAKPQCLADLPPYVFNHSRSYWWESQHMKAHRFRKHPRLDLLGAPDPTSTNLQMRWRNFLRVKEMPWVVDHQVQNTILYPGAGMLAMALEAGKQLSESTDVSGFELTDVRIMAAMVIPPTSEGLETYLTLKPDGEDTGKYDFVISSRTGESLWRENCRGRLHICTSSTDQILSASQNLECAQTVSNQMRETSPRHLYELFESQGMKWGHSFQNVSKISLSGDGRSCSHIRIPDIKSILPARYEQPHLIHPAFLDALFQSMVFALPQRDGQKVPTSLDYVYVNATIPSAAGIEMQASATMHHLGLRSAKGSATMQLADSEVPLVVVEGLQCSAIDKPQGSMDQDVSDMLCSEAVWREDVDLLIDGRSTLNSNDNENEFNADDFIETYVNLSGFKNPDLAILEVGKASNDLTRKLLQALAHSRGGIPRLRRYTLAGEAGPDLSEFAPFVEFKQVDFDVEMELQGFMPAAFDMIIASGIISEAQELRKVFERLHYLLRPGGKLLINEDADLSFEKTNGDLELDLAQNSFRTNWVSKGITNSARGTTTTCVATKEAAIRQSMHKDIVILCSAQQRETGSVVSTLVAKLQASYDAAVITLDLQDAFSRGVDDTIVISFLELPTLGVQEWTESELIAFKHILTANYKLLWITQGAQLKSSNPGAASIMGILRALRYEDSRLKPHALDLSPEIFANGNEPAAGLVSQLLRKILFDDAYDQEYEFAEQHGKIFIPRMLPEMSLNETVAADQRRTAIRPFLQPEPLSLIMLSPGQVDSLCFQQDHLAKQLGEDEVQIQVTSHGVHRLDAMTMAGDTTSSTFGYSAAGTVTSVGDRSSTTDVGDRMLILRPGTLTNTLHARPEELHTVPRELTLSQAAGLAAEFALAQYALVQAARLEPRESCLIDDPTSALGQAALLFAKHQGANVFALVSDETARELLVDTCGLSPDQIVDSTLLASHYTAKERRWDIIFCDMDSSNIEKLWDRLADFGRLIQVLPSNLIKKPKLDKLPVHSNTAFITVDLESVRQHKPHAFHRAVKEGLALLSQEHARLDNLVQEMPITSLTTAYKTVAETRTATTNIALTSSQEDLVPILSEDPHPLSSSLHPNGTYLIVGGLGGLGRSIATYLVSNGAKHIAFLSRSGGKSNASETQAYLQTLHQLGAITATSHACDVSNETHLITTLRSISPPVKGIIQAAMVLQDALFENMTHASWQASLRPKIQGTLNLHNASSILPSPLDFFITLSSIAGEGGMRGQTNYAAGNAYQDSLARHRRAQGLPAVCIDVTVVLGVGVVAENPELIDGLKQAGVLSMRENQLHKLIKAAITGHTSSTSPTPAQIITGVATGSYLSRNAIQDPIWQHDNRFLHTNKHGLSPSDPTLSLETNAPSLPTLLSQAKTPHAARAAVTAALSSKLAVALGIPISDIEASKSVSAYGVDSLVAVELRNWIQRRAKAGVSIFEIMSGVPIRELAGRIAGRSGFVGEGVRFREEEVGEGGEGGE